MECVELRNVRKKIRTRVVLDNITYKFKPGTIYGIVGPNGSGKTMLLRMLAGLIHPSEGEVFINGRLLHSDISFPENMGLIIEHMSLLPYLSGRDNLRTLARIRKIASEKDIEEALVRVGLEKVMDLKVKTYSLGMKQRLNLAQALFEKPELLLLDEPTNALDEKGSDSIRAILLEEKNRGAMIVMTSHHMDDIRIADTQLRMSEGRFVS